MEKSKNFTHVYGYIVCIISVIVFLSCVTSLVNAVMNRMNPLLSTYDSQNLASFEAYKLEQTKSFNAREGEQKKEMPNDQELRRIYDSLRQEKIDRVNFDSNKSIMVSSILIVLSILLFWSHWQIARKYIHKTDEQLS
ncbi:hypothetical protein [Bacteroides sedimenti]|uniref:Uncharacterized protein n=1 Tax=Bacteroides sedimenti TaxID=2136147 RepID=A0ABM8IBR0_9BACE